MNNIKIAVIGLGYVGLPLAVEFAKKYPVIGFDINGKRVSQLNAGHDLTLEVEDILLQSVLSINKPVSKGIYITDIEEDIRDCNYYIVTVPTPTDKYNRPVLTPLLKASETVGKYLQHHNVVVYESTVYPGATEEDCVPVLETISGLKYNQDFFVGYSPERINPGDKEHTVTKIKKVTSGSTPDVAKDIDKLYKSVIEAGTFQATSIRVAEAAKVIENSQRDINIAFVNELAKIFRNLNIDTKEVLEAASTKWNFLQFSPGLVGGHCIGVDPYYLAQKALETNYNPEIILAGRRMNDGMGQWVASQIIRLMIQKGMLVKNSKILVLGITFKENCPDIRNTKVINIINELELSGCAVDVYDPWANPEEVYEEYGINLLRPNLPDFCESVNQNGGYDAVVLAVAHNNFKTCNINKLKSHSSSVVYDVKSFWNKDEVDGRL